MMLFVRTNDGFARLVDKDKVTLQNVGKGPQPSLVNMQGNTVEPILTASLTYTVKYTLLYRLRYSD